MTTSGMWCTNAVDMALAEVARRLQEKNIRARIFSVITSLDQLRHVRLTQHLSDNSYVAIPICEDGHYVAFVVRDGWIYYYDSLAAHDTDLGYFGAQWVYARRDYIRASMTGGVKFSVMRQPRQQDAVRCAAYMLSFVTIAPQVEPEVWPYHTTKQLDHACRVLDVCTTIINTTV